MKNLNNTKLAIMFFFTMMINVVNAQIRPAEPLSGKSITKDFITRSLIYPANDLDANKSGKVIIRLQVDPDGLGHDYMVKSTFSQAAAAVALDLVKKIVWSPATNNGIPMSSETEYAVEFNAKSYNRYWKKHDRPALPLDKEADDSYDVYHNRQVEEPAHPYFASGSSMAQYIYENLKFPMEAQEREIQGTVRVSFIVETDGNVSNVMIVNSVGGGCDNEAVRLIEGTLWIPAIKDDKYVRSQWEQDITFQIGQRNYQDGNSY